MSAASSQEHHCPVCEGNTFRPLYERFDRRFESCRGCGFVRMADPPTDAELDTRYHEDRQHGELAWQEHEKNLGRFGEMIARIEKFVQPGKFLDVGCSLGTSLVAARERGWDPVGIELSRPSAEFGVKQWDIDIRTVTLDNAGFEPKSFRAVFMHHTLEHLNEPDRVLRRVFEVLEPGGVMYQALPNYDCLKRRLLGKTWSYGITDDHVVHFGARTLKRLVRRLGFEVREVRRISYREDPRLLRDFMERTGRLDKFMAKHGRAGEPFDVKLYVKHITENRRAHWFCNRMWPARLVTWMGLGEDLHLIAQKPE